MNRVIIVESGTIKLFSCRRDAGRMLTSPSRVSSKLDRSLERGKDVIRDKMFTFSQISDKSSLVGGLGGVTS